MQVLPGLTLLTALISTVFSLPIQDAEERIAEADGGNFPIPTPTISIPTFPLPTGFPTGVYTVPPITVPTLPPYPVPTITIPTTFSFPIPTLTPPPIPTFKRPKPTITLPVIPTSFPWFAAN